MSTEQHYADRNHEAQGLHYITHVSAMTAEGLHRKSAIAAELAHRDIEIARLKAENEALSNKLQTFEALGGAVDDLHLLRMGYAAARLEIASLQARLEASQKTNDDWAKRTHAMDAKNLGLLHALTAEQDENHALHQQLAAIGAGGVEPLRKTDTAARGTDAQIIKERELCAYAFAGALVDGLSCGTGPDTQESEWLRPAFEAGQEIAQLRAEIDKLRKRECLHSISEPEAQPVGVAPEWWRKRADEIETDVARGGSIAAMNCYTKMRQLLQAATSPPPAPQVQADALNADVLRDAERYRFIRDVPYSDDVRSVLVHQQNAAMDRVIDAARAAQEGL